MEWEIVKAVGWLIVVLGGAIGILWFAKRSMLHRQSATPGRVPVTVCGYAALQPKKSIFVVRIAERYLVVGVSDQTISRLAELDAPPVDPGSPAVVAPAGFAEALRRAFSKT
jgi:flagellar biosynthetic protein FliO